MRQVKIIIGLVIMVVILIVSLFIARYSNRNIERKYSTAMVNLKAYSDQLGSSEKENRAFKLTVAQLETSRDSIFQELNETRKKLKVKDSNVRNLQYVASSFLKTDTITLPGDTIFRDQQVNIDTLLSDEWYSVRVGLRYPSTVAINPEFKSIKHIVVSARKETVNPPKRFFLFRWFQKKHTVLNVEVIEKNPYVQSQTNRYVEIIR